MCDEESRLEKVANRLLRQMRAAADPEYPAFSDHYLADRDCRRAREVSLEEIFDATVVSFSAVDDLFEATWCEIRSGAKKAGCTERQIEFLNWRRLEMSYKEISEITGWSERVVKRDLESAAAIIQHIPAFGLWSVMAEIFRVHVRRIKALMLDANEQKWTPLD